MEQSLLYMTKQAMQENMIKKVMIMEIFLNLLKNKYQKRRQNRKRHGLKGLYCYYINRDSANDVGLAGATKQAVATTHVLQQPVS